MKKGLQGVLLRKRELKNIEPRDLAGTANTAQFGTEWSGKASLRRQHVQWAQPGAKVVQRSIWRL